LVFLAALPQILTAFIPQKALLNCIYNIYTIIEFILVYFFIGNKASTLFFKKISRLTVMFFVLFLFVLIINEGLTNRFLNELVCVANIIYVSWIFSYVLENLFFENELLNIKLPMFWYLTGLILYTTCTALVFSFYYSIGKTSILKNLWIIHNVFNTLMYILFAVGLYKSTKQNSLQQIEN